MRTGRLAVIVLAFLVGTISLTAYAEEEELFDTKAASKHIDQGVEYLKAKKLDAAIREFEESASINPDAEAYYYLGYTYYLKGRQGDSGSTVKSRENFLKAYEIQPNFTPSRFKPAEAVPAEKPVAETKQAPASVPSATPASSPTATAQAQPAPAEKPAQ